MRLKSVTVKPSFIEPTWETRNSQGDYEEQSHKFKEKPRDVFYTAIQDLKGSVQTVMGFTAAQIKEIIVVDFSVKRTDSGVRSFIVKYRQAFTNPETTKEYTTPPFRIDPPAEGEDAVPRAVDTDQAILCVTALEAVEQYIEGDRQQMTLEGIAKKTEGAEPNEGTELGLDDTPEKSDKKTSTQP